MKIYIDKKGFILTQKKKAIFAHSSTEPMIYIGYGQESIDMYRGNFKIEDYIIERYPLRDYEFQRLENGYIVTFAEKIIMSIQAKNDLTILDFQVLDKKINRFWIRICAEENEKCYGCGEQMSYFNLRGRNYPLWTSEPGVGRDKSTYVTWRSDVENRAGGDYYHTNYPQPTFVSTKKYYLHVESNAYADFNFKNKDFHELHFWEVPKSIRIEAGENYLELLKKLTSYFGRQPQLPDWIYDGAILGLQGGTKRVFSLVERSNRNGIKVCGIWCQDWAGIRNTTFGKRLNWNWKWNKALYPKLADKIKEYKDKGMHFLAYANPYIVQDGSYYQEALENGYFATNSDGSEYLADFGEFYCGIVDLTNPEAYQWFKNTILKENMLDMGIDGWMADFGEYLPTDVKLYNNMTPMTEHNYWPVRWAKCNYEALEETGNIGKAVFFMRAAGAGIQKYCTLLWAGDQSVDFSLHDGLATTITGALSAGMCGCTLHHSDIGGYTSLFGNVRTKEVFLRWAEMAVFSPVMRTHESNRPDVNFQYYNDGDTMELFARLVDIHVLLKPYLKQAVNEAAVDGIPVQRPLFLHYENDIWVYDIQTEYLLGRDLLVAPVYQEKIKQWQVYLPEDRWVHLWTGKIYEGGEFTVDAPVGYIPVFYRQSTGFRKLFEKIKSHNRKP